ncbi:MAG: RNA 2',3'-cyclic phosphodiesterase [Abditibacteriota bacterium]|nr:RNA 2',3'-cyclic phosphodiesterase [Abditibacteriota bacterium]
MTKRLFIAVEIDPRVRAALAEKSAETKNLGAKPVSEECFHITLAFLGDTDEERIADVAASVEAAAEGLRKFEVRLRGVALMSREARVIYTEAESGGCLEDAAKRLSEELSARGIEKDKKPFRAHVTLGRLRRGADARVREFVREAEFSQTFTAEFVTVFESTLTPKGPIYDPLATFKLM